MNKTDASPSSIAARVAALPSTPFAELKKLWATSLPSPTKSQAPAGRAPHSSDCAMH